VLGQMGDAVTRAGPVVHRPTHPHGHLHLL